MSERRDCRITSNIEPTFAILVERACVTDGITLSQYIRQLIVHDLNARKMLTPELLLRIATVESVEQLERLAAETVAVAAAS